MSDTSNTPQTPQQLREAFDRVKQERDEARTKAAEGEHLARENAMLKAGVDPEHPAYGYFEAGYKGELDTDAIKAEWAKLAPPVETPPAGEAPPPPGDGGQESGDGPTAEEREHQRQQEAFRAGSVPPGGEPTPDPMGDALTGYQEARKQGATQVQAQRGALQKIFNAADAGDERIVSGSASEAQEKWVKKHEFG